MESLVKEGLCRSIGVSNFREEDLLEMKDHWTIPPAVNQVCYLLAVAGMPRVTDDDSSQFEYNPYVYHADNVQRLIKCCNDHNITILCYGPLVPLFRSTGGPVDPVVERIAKEKSATTSQILIAWAAQHSGGVVVT